jgi:hypothetical protein
LVILKLRYRIRSMKIKYSNIVLIGHLSNYNSHLTVSNTAKCEDTSNVVVALSRIYSTLSFVSNTSDGIPPVLRVATQLLILS